MRLENGALPEVIQFAAWLLDLGHGRNQHSPTHVQLPQSMVISRGATLEDLITVIYPNIATPNHPDQYFSDRMILAPRNADVHDINDRILEKFPGEETIYDSADSAIIEEGVDHPEPIPAEYLNSINASGLPRSKLALKVGSPILLLCNLSVTDGLCNGTRLCVEHLGRWVIQARILGGFHHGKVAFIPRMTLTPSDLGQLNFILQRRQFPVALAFAMTINKAQGQSVRNVGVDLRAPCFSHGQLYVALSRVTSPEKIKVIFPPGQHDRLTPNVVYHDVLID
jgi:hypothetical protein